MTVETATYIADLDATYPTSTDYRYEGDDHLRLIKSVLKATFPNLTGAVTATQANLNATASTAAGAWVLMSSVSVTAVAAIDFVNGSGGVTISDAYDQYQIVINDILGASSTSALELQASSDSGSTWFPTVRAQAATIIAGTQTITNVTSGFGFALTGPVTCASTDSVHCLVDILRRPGVASGDAIMSHFVRNSAATAAVGSAYGYLRASSATNAYRLRWASGNFTAGSTIKFFARKAA